MNQTILLRQRTQRPLTTIQKIISYFNSFILYSGAFVFIYFITIFLNFVCLISVNVYFAFDFLVLNFKKFFSISTNR